MLYVDTDIHPASSEMYPGVTSHQTWSHLIDVNKENEMKRSQANKIRKINEERETTTNKKMIYSHYLV